MWWLFVALSSYILLAGASLIDKILLGGKLSNPKVYAFYVGILSSLAFLFLPFGVWSNPAPELFFIGVAAGAAQIYGSYFYLSALKRFEASRAVPVIGGLVPIFGFFLTVIVSGGTAILGLKELAGFILLIAGSWLTMAQGISIKKINFNYVFQASFLFALSVVLAKLVYLQRPFLEGFVLTAFGSAAAAITFLFSGAVRQTVFGNRAAREKTKPGVLFFFGQIMGGIAFALQSYSVSLAPQASVPVINAMAGVQYIVIFALSFFLAMHYPKSFKEKITSATILQRLLAITLIMLGLAIFAWN